VAQRRQTPTVRLRRLAAELRGMRETAQLSREDVSAQTNINAVTLYRIETARVRPQRRTLLALLDQYAVTDETKRNELIALAKEAAQLDWLQAYESELPEHYTAYISFEAEARTVRNYESLFVPGLLQTETYTRALATGVLQRRVEVRMQRQASITKNDPLHLWAVLDEAVLHRRVGGPAVMHQQLQHLAEMGQRPHITIQVVPFGEGAHPGMAGAFAHMSFPDAADPDLVYVESMAGGTFLEREPDVRRCTALFDHLTATALTPAASLDLITAAQAAMR
jgi:transcriptional regulator with XRE-family HTH domain